MSVASTAPSLIAVTALGTINDIEQRIKSGADVNQVAEQDIIVRSSLQSNELNHSEYLIYMEHLYGPDSIAPFLNHSVRIPAGATPLFVAAQIVHDVAKVQLLLANGAKIPDQLSDEAKLIVAIAKKK